MTMSKGPAPAPDQRTPANVEVEDDDIYEDESEGYRVGDIYIPPPVKPYCSTESTGPRLIITNISNHNFKSYAGTVVLGPFHQRFSAIIGPNGSGKSNVIDSILFVFGYRAQKIRSKKLSVLLHNSARYPNCTSCTVEVHFMQILDKPDGSLEQIPGSELIIARTAFRDNSSFYTINGKKTKFNEVAKLLSEHGIDLDHNRFLILQGEVESIALMKPKALTENECGLLEYLEDIIGTTRYKKPLNLLNARVEQLNEERTDKHNRCKLAEREMNDLEEPMNEAVDFLKFENSTIQNKSLYIQKQVSELKKEVVEITADKDLAFERLKQHDEKHENLRKEREQKEILIREEIKQYESLVKRKELLITDKTKEVSNFEQAMATMSATNKRRKTNMAQKDKEVEKLEELKKVPEKNRRDIAECETKIEQLTQQKIESEEKLEINYTTLKDETKDLISQKETLETELIDVTRVMDEHKSVFTIAQSELKLCKEKETIEIQKYNNLKVAFEENMQSLQEKEANFAELEELVPKLVQEVADAKKLLSDYKQEEATLAPKLNSLKSKIQESSNAMQVTRSASRVLNGLMKQKQDGNIPGILGRLGDLGGIDSKYDVAISTCCGRLDDIIVDTVSTAQSCIDYLKKYDVGRANFVALEKVQHLRQYCESRIQTPENVPRLFDLIRMEDDRVRPAFYFALRDTLVANNLEQGTRIAYGRQRYRVVTLEGGVIETSGTMSGGGRTQLRGKMGQKVTTKTAVNLGPSDNEIQQMQVKADEMQQRLFDLQNSIADLESNLNRSYSVVRAKENEYKKKKIELEMLPGTMQRVKYNLEQQLKFVNKSKADPVKVAELENKVTKSKDIFEKSETAVKKIKDKVAVIAKQITDITNAKVGNLQKKITELVKLIDKLTANISKLNVEITASERNLKKSEDKIANLEDEIKTAQEEILKFDAARKNSNEIIEELIKAIADLEKELETCKTGSETKKEIIAIQKQESDGKIKRIEIEDQLKVVEKKLKDTARKIPAWGKQLEGLTLHQIPGDESSNVETIKEYTEEELENKDLESLGEQVAADEEKLGSTKPNLSVIDEYLAKRDAYLKKTEILDEITKKRNEMRQVYEDVKKRRFKEFLLGFTIITKKLKEMYQMITLGGDAELELIDSMDPFTEGIVFNVRPAKKSWKIISNLSGGEKTLSSLALVFALHYYKPSPLYIMDEIDAALDFKNVSIVANYIKEKTKNAQFIIISLRSNMFELSDILVGIYKVNDCTASAAIANDAVEHHHQPVDAFDTIRGNITDYGNNKTILNDFEESIISNHLANTVTNNTVLENREEHPPMEPMQEDVDLDNSLSNSTLQKNNGKSPTIESSSNKGLQGNTSQLNSSQIEPMMEDSSNAKNSPNKSLQRNTSQLNSSQIEPMVEDSSNARLSLDKSVLSNTSHLNSSQIDIEPMEEDDSVIDESFIDDSVIDSSIV